jgi:hypothetical protein
MVANGAGRGEVTYFRPYSQPCIALIVKNLQDRILQHVNCPNCRAIVDPTKWAVAASPRLEIIQANQLFDMNGSCDGYMSNSDDGSLQFSMDL